jgi:hypothetical protein
MRKAPFHIGFLLVLALAIALGCNEDTVLTPPPGGSDTIPPIPDPVDTIPPAPVPALNIRYSLVEEKALLEWTAPYDDNILEPVTQYEIRYSYTSGFVPPNFWDLSTPVDDPPAPGAPGSDQQYTFSWPPRGKDLYVGIRSYDERNNRSPNSDLAMVHIPGHGFAGRVVDGITHAPIEGLAVRLAAGGFVDLATDAEGSFSVDDVRPGALNVEIKMGPATIPYHRFSQSLVLDRDMEKTFTMIPYEEPVSPYLQSLKITILGLFKFLTDTDRPTHHVFARWHTLPVACYIPPFVNSNGVDYQALAIAAADQWMSQTGVLLFDFVDAPPDTGVTLNYRRREDIAPLIGITFHETGDDDHPIRSDVHVINDFANEHNLFKVMLHELGHTIRLWQHMATNEFIMFGGQPLPDVISDDEVTVVKLHTTLPVRVDMNHYDESPPEAVSR